MLTCKNCQTGFDGHYCPNCGQKYINKRFTLKDSISWAFHSIFNFDKGFFYTSKELLIRPGLVVKEFLDGITVRYAHPFRFIFIWATISALLSIYTGTYEMQNEAFSEIMQQEQSEAQAAFNEKVKEITKQYLSFLIMLSVPLFSIGSYFAFKKFKRNYAEHLILNSFGYASVIFIGIPFSYALIYFNHPLIASGTGMLVNVIVLTRIYSSFFEISYIKAFLRYFLTMLIVLILGLILLIIFIFAFVFILKAMGIDLKQFAQ